MCQNVPEEIKKNTIFRFFTLINVIFFSFVSFIWKSYCTTFFLFCTYNTVSITIKRVSKRSSFRYAFQEHLIKSLMLTVTHSELLLRDHCISRHLNSKVTIVRLFTSVTKLPNIIFLALCFEVF
jgi:hypothetical protein